MNKYAIKSNLGNTMKTSFHLFQLSALSCALALTVGCSTGRHGTVTNNSTLPGAVPAPAFVNYPAQKQMLEIIRMQHQLKMMNSIHR